MAHLTNEQLHEIGKNILKAKVKNDKEFEDCKRAIVALDQLNILYHTGNISKSDFIEGIIQCKDFMIKSLT